MVLRLLPCPVQVLALPCFLGNTAVTPASDTQNHEPYSRVSGDELQGEPCRGLSLSTCEPLEMPASFALASSVSLHQSTAPSPLGACNARTTNRTSTRITHDQQSSCSIP